MKRYQLLQVTSPLVELECGGHTVRTDHIPNTKKNPNFPKPIVSMDVVSVCVCVTLYVASSSTHT